MVGSSTWVRGPDVHLRRSPPRGQGTGLGTWRPGGAGLVGCAGKETGSGFLSRFRLSQKVVIPIVIEPCAVGEIARPVVVADVVEMTDDLPRWTRAEKRFRHKVMNL